MSRGASKVIMTEGDITAILRKLTLPMIFGILGLVAFNLADTYFVGRLGTLQIAALTFTFPVVLVLNSINMGIGIGTSSVVSRAAGEGDKEKVGRLATASLSLGFLIAFIAIVIGELTIEPLFKALGAQGDTMPYIRQYMRIWYAGVPFIAIPMIGNNVIRALGDTKTPSIVMMVAAGVNIILDPLLIFGLWIFPEMGVAGAAIATVLSRMFTFIVSLYILSIREKVISFKWKGLAPIFSAWKLILFIGIPNSIARIILPIGIGVITRLIAKYGVDAVAGYGISTRFEYFALAVPQALASIMPVFVGQNFGAGKLTRITTGLKIGQRFMLIYGMIVYAVLFIAARPLANVFTEVEEVIDMIVLYMRIIPLGYGVQGMILLHNGALNALHMPVKAASISILQMLVIYVPTALIVSEFFGVIGIFSALVASYLITSIYGRYLIEKNMKCLYLLNTRSIE